MVLRTVAADEDAVSAAKAPAAFTATRNPIGRNPLVLPDTLLGQQTTRDVDSDDASPSDNRATDAPAGQFRLVKLLGEGGMGKVYEADDLVLQRRVALKILKPTGGQESEKTLRRLLREARAAAKLDHPNVVAVYQTGRIEEKYYIAMQLVRGCSAAAVPEEGWPAGKTISIVRATAHALAVAHAAGLVHRDVKPQNILLDRNGSVKLSDFGLAQETKSAAVSGSQTSIHAGTAAYMSPEQAQGSALDGRSDLYSLGATWFHLLTGRPPFLRLTPLDLMAAHVLDSPPDPRSYRSDVPEEVAGVVQRLLAKNPLERFQTATELLAELEKLQPAGDSAYASVLAVDSESDLEQAPTSVHQLALIPAEGTATLPSEAAAAKSRRLWVVAAVVAFVLSASSVALWCAGIFAQPVEEAAKVEKPIDDADDPEPETVMQTLAQTVGESELAEIPDAKSTDEKSDEAKAATNTKTNETPAGKPSTEQTESKPPTQNPARVVPVPAPTYRGPQPNRVGWRPAVSPPPRTTTQSTLTGKLPRKPVTKPNHAK